LEGIEEIRRFRKYLDISGNAWGNSGFKQVLAT